MVLKESNDALTLGSQAPDFTLSEPITGRTFTLEDFKGGAGFLLMFLCNHCPYVMLLKEQISLLCKEYKQKGFTIVAISSNSIQTYPEDGPDKMAEDSRQYDYCFPYLYDETQAVAKAYNSVCTPEFFVFDKDMKLAYHGQFDDARPGSGREVTGQDLRNALDCVLAGKEVPLPHKRCMGCNIKWHPGNEPR
eukprot:TRINITY_DN4558_c0_g1_i5.p2 TRINITY_DN4558_c0_g1~~TRINITY_DN4558_c0_g1_i5.p2  ORF type:complete len:192 (-),score=29.40 TRINITY_DN4558_c0_g1_i5:643-1218(-)